MEFTLIVTVGPSILSRIDKLNEIQAAGPCIFRLNGAHCSPEQLKIYHRVIKSVIPQAKVMIDLPGNKVRTAQLPSKIQFLRGERFTLRSTDFNFPGFPAMVFPGDEILACDANLRFHVERADPDSILLRAEHSGELTSGRGMHLRNISDRLPFLFPADLDLLRAAAESGLALVSLSYVRSAKDIRETRALIHDMTGFRPEIIAKVETEAALRNLEEILAEVNTINIDRGDLSSDIGLLELASSQARVIRVCQAAGKNVLLATQCLKNMETRPVPLIPEILDLSYSIRQGVSGVQLSEETAIGLYPLECIQLVWKVYQQERKGPVAQAAD